MIVISRGQTWINTFTGEKVIVGDVTEDKLELKSSSGFTYQYPFSQFLQEYRNENLAAR